MAIPTPNHWSGRDMNEVLVEAFNQGASDVSVMSDSPISFRKNGIWVPVTNPARPLLYSDVRSILDDIRMKGSAGEIRGHEDLDFAVGITIGRGKRIRFRVNATGIYSNSSDGIEIVFRTLPSIPPSMSDIGIPKDLEEGLFPHVGLVIVAGATGCHGKGTGIRMADGSVKKVEVIEKGDIVAGPDGYGRTVLDTVTGIDALFNLKTETGRSVIINGGHVIPLITKDGNGRNHVVLRTVDEYMSEYPWIRDQYHVSVVGVDSGIAYEKFELESFGVGEYFGFKASLDSLYQDENGIVHHNSGKSTFLASVFRHLLENDQKHILTYEAPIEFVYDEIKDRKGIISQSEIPTNLPSFARAVRNSLRRAPDVILIGESRDPETIAGCITASQTGHAVYTTTHVNSSAASISRMIGEFPAAERSSMALKLLDSVRTIVHQRLIKNQDGSGRVAVREYIIFDADFKSSLMETSWENWTMEIQKEMNKRQTSLKYDVARKIEEGKLGHYAYQWIDDVLDAEEKAELIKLRSTYVA